MKFASSNARSKLRLVNVFLTTQMFFFGIAQAQDRLILNDLKRNYLTQAIRLKITPRGQERFQKSFGSILEGLGVNLSEGYFPEQSYNAQDPIDLDELEKQHPDQIQVVKQVRSVLTKWLIGFTLQPHRPSVRIGPSEYQAQFKKFGLYTDSLLMNQLGKKSGAVLALELEIESLNAQTGPVRVWDQNNPDLGIIGYENVEIKSSAPEHPIQIRIPFFVDIDSNGELQFQTLQISDNFNSVPINLSLKNLIAPKISVSINGKVYDLNQNELENTIVANMPNIVDFLKNELHDLVQNEIPNLLNEKAKEILSGSLEQIQDMEPAGKEATDPRPDFKWGIKMSQIQLNEGNLSINFHAFVEDTYRNPHSPLNPPLPVVSSAARGSTMMTGVASQNYDVAMSIDRALINRILQLSYFRGNFAKIPQKDGSSLSLVASPIIDYTPYSNSENLPQIKIRATIQTQPDSIFLDDTIVLSFDIIAKLIPASSGKGLQIQLITIDTSTMNMDERYLSTVGHLFKSRVYQELRQELSKRSRNWNRDKEMIPGTLPLPPSLLGMELDISKCIMEPNGQLVLYMTYEK